jgi:hypothetical protein
MIDWSGDSDTEFDPDGEIIDEEDEYDLPMFSYDADDPCIDVNVVFPDVDQCKLVVTHHVILHDHAFNTMKKTQQDLGPYARELIKVVSGLFSSISKKYARCKVLINSLCWNHLLFGS